MENNNTNPTLDNEAKGSEEQSTEKKSYTQEELDAIVQKEADRRVSQAMKTAEKKNADKMREAEKLAQMDATQKYEYQLEQRERAIAEKEKQLALAENKNVAGKILADKGLSLDFIDFVVAEEAESMNLNIKAIEKAFKASVKAEVEKRIGTKAPRKAEVPYSNLTKADFAKMSLAQQAQLYKDEPEIYKSLI